MFRLHLQLTFFHEWKKQKHLPLLVLANEGTLKLAKDGATDATLPLVRLDIDLKPAPLPKPENDAVPTADVREKPLKALKAPPLSPCYKTTKLIYKSPSKHMTGCLPGHRRSVTSAPTLRRLAFLMERFFITSSVATENIPAWRHKTIFSNVHLFLAEVLNRLNTVFLACLNLK